jgi:hypothetical protein
MSGIAFACEVQKPHQSFDIRRKADVKGRSPAKHSLYFLSNRSRGAQGNQMTGKYETAVAVGGAGADVVLLNKADTFAFFRQIVGAGLSDISPADYENIAVSVHFIAYAFPI